RQAVSGRFGPENAPVPRLAARVLSQCSKRLFCGTARLQPRPFAAQRQVSTPKRTRAGPAGTARLSSWTNEGRARLGARGPTVLLLARAGGGRLLHLLGFLGLPLRDELLVAL